LHVDGKSIRRYDSAGLRVFGGGALLCPGRHYANSVILAFAARMLLRFDVCPAGKKQPANSIQKRKWDSLQGERSFGLGVAKVFLLPDQDPEVEIRTREGCSIDP
jgi:hypothetical protein